MRRLERAVGRLDVVVQRRPGRMAPTIERELLLIARAVSSGMPRDAADRAERLAISWSIRPRPAPDLRRCGASRGGCTVGSLSRGSCGGAEPTRESCRGRHAQVPGPREVRQPEHDADETPDTCSSRSPVSELLRSSRARCPGHRWSPPPARLASRTGTARGARPRDPGSPRRGGSSVCTASSGTKAVQSAIATFG